MDSATLYPHNRLPSRPGDYLRSISEKRETAWIRLGEISVKRALEAWYHTLSPHTRKNYRSGMNRLISMGFLNVEATLQQFSLVNHEAKVDEIKLVNFWSEATRQARAAGYISFTSFLHRRTQGIVTRALPSKEGSNRTFFKVRDKVKTPALSKEQTKRFLHELGKINYRDCLIAKVTLQGGKRKGEVLALRREDIHFAENCISFDQSKTRGVLKQSVISYPPELMQELACYLGERNGLVFVTRNIKKVCCYQLNRTFAKAGQLANIPFHVTPHVLRVTLVTRLKELHVQDTDIMKITGHASPAQLASYDKSDIAENATRHHHFV